MPFFVSQEAASALQEVPGNFSVSQELLGVFNEAPGNFSIAQTVLLALYEPPSPQNVSQTLVESALSVPGSFSIAQTVAAFLVCYDQIHPILPEYTPMSDFLLPTLPGLMWTNVKKPKFGTNIAPHVSGREVRVSNYSYPLYEWELKYEFLRADAYNELQQLMGFYLARRGMFDSFLYRDPQENNVYVNNTIGVGDNFKTEFTVTKTFGGFVEPVGYVDPATLLVYKDNVLQTIVTDYTFQTPNTIKLTTAPTIGQVISASYTWYYRVRFGEDSQGYENFMYQLWTLKKMTIESIKP